MPLLVLCCTLLPGGAARAGDKAALAFGDTFTMAPAE
jgi:hypothetical protein